MAKGIIRKIEKATKQINQEIAISARGRLDNKLAGALAREGYTGGYCDALQDVLLLLNGCEPCHKPDCWK